MNACNFFVARSMAKNRTTLSLQNNPTEHKFYVMQTRRPVKEDAQSLNQLPFGAGIIIFFLILAHPVYKM